MLIIFTVKDQKITHDLKGSLVSDSAGIVQAAFSFDSSWDYLKKAIVFSNSSCKKPVPVKYTDTVINIPTEALKPGKLYVSVVGFGEDEQKKTTQKWDIQQAITVQKCGDMGDCDLLRNLACGYSEDDVATDTEVDDMLDSVFGEDDPAPDDPSEPTVSEEDVATDEEVVNMLDEVFGPATPAP